MLARLGIAKVRDLLERSESELKSAFGEGWRSMLACAQGMDAERVEVEREDARSYSQQETFSRNISDFSEIVRIVKRMIDELMGKIREDRKQVRTLTVKVRYPDFSQASHGRSLDAGTDLEAPFYPWVEELLREAWSLPRPLRLVSVRFSNVEDASPQLEMFAEENEKRRRLAQVLDGLNRSGGQTVVRHGHQLARKPGKV